MVALLVFPNGCTLEFLAEQRRVNVLKNPARYVGHVEVLRREVTNGAFPRPQTIPNNWENNMTLFPATN